MHLSLRAFLVACPDHRWIRIPGDPPAWCPAPQALPRIPPAHLDCDAQVSPDPSAPGACAGQVFLPELGIGYAWRTTPPQSPSMVVRWRSWLRDGRR